MTTRFSDPDDPGQGDLNLPASPSDLNREIEPDLIPWPDQPPEPPVALEAPASRGQQAILFIVATAVLLLDQVTKRWIEANLPLYESLPIWNLAPYFQFTHTTNTGAAFGLFQNGGTLFGVIAVIVGIAIMIYNFQLPAGHWWLRIALGLQLGGAFGNLVDRLRQGYVTDFLNADFSSVVDLPFANIPVFNVADAGIVGGVMVLALLMILEGRGASETVTAPLLESAHRVPSNLDDTA